MAEPNISFIPKKPLARTDTFDKRPISLFGVIAVVITIATLGAYAALFYYTHAAEGRITEKQTQLQTFYAQFDKTIIGDAKSLEARITAVQGILNTHRTLSPVFELLERVTLKTVQLTSFEYTDTEGTLKLTLGGEAPSFAALAYQRDLLLKEVTSLQKFDITDFKLNDFGGVTFKAEAVLAPQTVEYRTQISEQSNATSTTTSSTDELIASTTPSS